MQPRPGVKRTFRVLEDQGPDGTFRVIEEKLVDRLGAPCWLPAYLADPFVADLCEGAYHQGVYDNE